MSENNPPVTEGQAGRSFDVFLAPLDQSTASDSAGIVSPLYHHQGNDDFVDSLTQQGDQHQCHQNRRETQLNVHHSHDQGLHLAAEIRSNQTNRTTDAQGNQSAQDPHAETGPETIKDCAQ